MRPLESFTITFANNYIMKSNILLFALILFPGIALSIAPKKRDFVDIQPVKVVKKTASERRAIHKAELYYYGPFGKIELPTEGSEPENTLFPTPSLNWTGR